jgi:hypothetical protein
MATRRHLPTRPHFAGWILRGVAVALGAAALSLTASAPGGKAAEACGLPSTTPLWIDYAEGSVAPDVRAVFARPGVVVTASGTVIPKYFRDHGAATTYFVLHLPALVGEPSDPADPGSIADAASSLFKKATASTACSTPVIALNELFGESLKTPWSPTNTVYRANVLALMRDLAGLGARPVLFVHGNPNTDGDAAEWWRQIASAGQIVYELYFNGAHLSELGTVIAARRVRLGARGFVNQYKAIGITPERLGIALGFHSSRTPGVGGRQGLEPATTWLRVIKWQTLATQQVAVETGLGSIWSWGWALFGAHDPDKVVSACTYLWARSASICDAPAMAGAGFNASRPEGQIVLPESVSCSFAAGHVRTADVDGLAAVIHDPHGALSAVFSRVSLRSAAAISPDQVLAAERETIERSFAGNRRAYLEALTRSHATLEVARAVIRDELRRRSIAEKLAGSSGPTMLEWTAEREARAVDTAICLHDDIPGRGGFPSTDAREVGVVPVLARLPYLFADREAPESPIALVAAPGGVGLVRLTWAYGTEADLAGYRVYRADTSGGPYTAVGPFLDRATLVDKQARGTTSYYVVRAVDTSGNLSEPTAEISATTP